MLFICVHILLSLNHTPPSHLPPSFFPSDTPGCGRPLGAAGDIRPVSAPRRADGPRAWWSSRLPVPPPLACASHCLSDCFAAAAAPLPWVIQSYYLHNLRHILQRDRDMHTFPMNSRCP